jgi:hypothetical protein
LRGPFYRPIRGMIQKSKATVRSRFWFAFFFGSLRWPRYVEAVAAFPAAMAQPAVPICRETGCPGRSHSDSFDHRHRPEMLRTAMATAFFCPTNTTSRFPRVTPV